MRKTEVSRGFREIKRQRGKNKRMKTFCLHCQNFLKYGKINLMKALLKHFFFLFSVCSCSLCSAVKIYCVTIKPLQTYLLLKLDKETLHFRICRIAFRLACSV